MTTMNKPIVVGFVDMEAAVSAAFTFCELYYVTIDPLKWKEWILAHDPENMPFKRAYILRGVNGYDLYFVDKADYDSYSEMAWKCGVGPSALFTHVTNEDEKIIALAQVAAHTGLTKHKSVIEIDIPEEDE